MRIAMALSMGELGARIADGLLKATKMLRQLQKSMPNTTNIMSMGS